MLWQGRRESENVEDDRGGGGGGRRLVMGGGVGSVVIAVIYLLMGGDPRALLDSSNQNPGAGQVQTDPNAPKDEMSQFVGVVLADTEDVWNTVFKQMGQTYQEPKLRLFSDQVE